MVINDFQVALNSIQFFFLILKLFIESASAQPVLFDSLISSDNIE